MAKTTAMEVNKAMGIDHRPCLHIDGTTVDSIGATELNKKVTFMIEGEVESVSQDTWSGAKKKHASIRISSIDGKPIGDTTEEPTDPEVDEDD